MKVYIVVAFVFASVFANVILVSTVFKLQAELASFRDRVRAYLYNGLGASAPAVFAFSAPHFERVHLAAWCVLLLVLALLAGRDRRVQ